MARPREPIDLIAAKGRKHLTKAEIEARRASEVQPCAEEIAAPTYLTAAQKKKFEKLAEQLEKIKIMGETDCDILGRYVVAQGLYEQAVKDLRSVQKARPRGGDLEGMVTWAGILKNLDKRCERYFKQANTAARELGLTISSRCKLQVPVAKEEPKVNKFAQFSEKAAGSK